MSDVAFRIGSEAITSAAGKLVEVGLTMAFSGAMSPISSAVAAAGLAKATSVLISELFSTTNQVEKKLDTIISEPFQTAKVTITEILSIRAANRNEHRECDRQLGVSLDSLRKAHNYAQTTNKNLCNTIRLYQSLVAALKEGGKPFSRYYLKELYDLANAYYREEINSKEKSGQARQDAERIDPNRYFDESIIVGSASSGPDPYLAQGYLALASMHDNNEKQSLTESANQFDQKAKQFRKYAGDIIRLCVFVEKVAINREMILGCEKK